MDVFFPQMCNQSRVLDAAHSMTNARWLQVLQRFPYACRAASLTRVSRTRDIVLDSILERWNMGIDGKAGFVARYIERDDVCSLEAFHQPGHLQALLR